MNENIDKIDEMQAKCDNVNDKLFDISKRLNDDFDLGEIEQCTIDNDASIEIENTNYSLSITHEMEIMICRDNENDDSFSFFECDTISDSIDMIKLFIAHDAEIENEHDCNLENFVQSIETFNETHVPDIETIRNDIEMENDVDNENDENEKSGITQNESPFDKSIDPAQIMPPVESNVDLPTINDNKIDTYQKLSQKQLRNKLRKNCNIYVGQFKYDKNDERVIVTTNHVHVMDFQIDKNVDDFKRDMFIDLLVLHDKK